MEQPRGQAVQTVEVRGRTLRFDLLAQTNVAVGSDLKIISKMVRHAAWLLTHFQAGSADGKTAYARQVEKHHESLVPAFGEPVMWKDPTLQPAKLRSSRRYGLYLGRSQTSNAHLLGTRVGIVVARTVRRLPSTKREETSLVLAMRSTPVAGWPADAAAGDTPTVTRHAVERRDVIVVPACCGAPMQVGSRESVSVPPQLGSIMPEPLVPRAHHRLHRKAASIQVRELSILVLETSLVSHRSAPTLKSHVPAEEHDESLVPKRQRG